MTVLLYASVPGFYAEVERSRNPDLEGRPVIVGGNPRKRGTVQAATPDARAAGVVDGMPLVAALELCPSARAVRTDMKAYREVAGLLKAELRRESERIEPAGVEAAWIDVSERGEPAREIAVGLRKRVLERLRLPLDVGIAPVKFLAKLAAEMADSDGVLEVRQADVRGFLDGLPVDRLPGVGRAPHEQPAWLAWLVLFVCILFPLLVIFAD